MEQTPEVSEASTPAISPEPSKVTKSRPKRDVKPPTPFTQTTKVAPEILERRRLGRQRAAEDMAKLMKGLGIERVENDLVQSNFKNVNLINQKNYYTDYLKKDDQIFALRERKLIRWGKKDDNDEEEEAEEEEAEEEGDERHGSKVIVIHPGSKYLRIGLASDVQPVTVAACVAIQKSANGCANANVVDTSDVEMADTDDAEYADIKKEIQTSFKDRMKYYKRRIIPNAHESVVNFNKKVQPQVIPDHNDASAVEYLSHSDTVLIGDDALRTVKENFTIRYPFARGQFNLESQDYKSFQELLGDIEQLIRGVLAKEFEITSLSGYKTVLIIPDLYDKMYIEEMIHLFLHSLRFAGVALMQEGVCATYGAGVTSACVVDIGATKTTVSCVEDGMVVTDSRVQLNYGGDDVTKLFIRFLIESEFPYQDINLDFNWDWSLAEHLKHKYATFHDVDVTVQLYDFYKRRPGFPVEKIEFKVFEEVMTAPMSMFYPEIYGRKKHNESYISKQVSRSQDVYTGEDDNPKSLSQTDQCYSNMGDAAIMKQLLGSTEGGNSTNFDNYTSLEKAIIQSITNAALTLGDPFSKLKTFYSNILLVGGASKIPDLDFILSDRINIWRPPLLASANMESFYKDIRNYANNFESKAQLTENSSQEQINALQDQLFKDLEEKAATYLENENGTHPVEILPPPREIDPSMLTWKGGSVYGRVKLVEEMWINERDWDLLGSRILQYKVLFMY